MEENVIVEESVDTLEPELLASIEKKAKELKEKKSVAHGQQSGKNHFPDCG